MNLSGKINTTSQDGVVRTIRKEMSMDMNTFQPLLCVYMEDSCVAAYSLDFLQSFIYDLETYDFSIKFISEELISKGLTPDEVDIVLKEMLGDTTRKDVEK